MRWNKLLYGLLAVLLASTLSSGALMEEIEAPVAEVVEELGAASIAEDDAPVAEAVEEAGATMEAAYVAAFGSDDIFDDFNIQIEGDHYDADTHTAYVGDALDLFASIWTENPDAKVVWAVNDHSVASFSEAKALSKVKRDASASPMLTLKKAGPLLLWARYDGQLSLMELEVIDRYAASTVDFKDIGTLEYAELYAQDPQNQKVAKRVMTVETELFDSLGGKVTDKAVSRALRWKISNTRIATVRKTSKPGEAKIYLKGTGNVRITVKMENGQSASFKLHVSDDDSPNAIFFYDRKGDRTQTITAKKNKKFYLDNFMDTDSAFALRRDSFTYRSQNPLIATVNRNGLVVPRRKGIVKLDVWAYNGIHKAVNLVIR